MAYQVFVSHSSKDAETANAVCAALEAVGIGCWIAPRDIVPGEDWSESIVDAITTCPILLLLFTSYSNDSLQVRREVHHAFDKGATVIPFRLEEVPPSMYLDYYIRSVHWLNALTAPLEAHFDYLIHLVQLLLTRIGDRAEVDLAEVRAELSGEAVEKAIAFPPVKDVPPSLSAWPHNLPPQVTSFVGRVNEIQAASELLAKPETRLLTLFGPGGTGKTRLAQEIATRSFALYPDGVWFVELETVTNVREVPTAVALALNIPLASDADARAALLASLRDRKLLLLLDNFEQVIEAARFVGDLLKACRNVVCMITSRQLLQIAAEQEFAVDPLRQPAPDVCGEDLLAYESIQLFQERATTARPNFVLSEETLPVVADLCRRLDGIPLAIELTAALVRGMSPQQILPRLKDRFRLLAGTRRDLDARQRSLRGAIDWSYDLLTEEEKALFAELSVFAGGWTMEAAEEVCQTVGAFDLLFTLRDKSLLKTEENCGQLRYFMLETLRDYGQEKLAQSRGSDAARDRHTEYYIQRAREWSDRLYSGGAEGDAAREALRADLANLRGGMDWAIAGGKDALTVAYGKTLCRYLRNAGLYEECSARFTAAEEAAKREGDRASLALLLNRHGLTYWDSTGCDDAQPYFEESYAVSKALGDPGSMLVALINLGNIAWSRSAFAEAQRIWEEALTLAVETEQTHYQAQIQDQLGLYACWRGDYAEADAYYQNSLRLYGKDSPLEFYAGTLCNFSELLLKRKQYAGAWEQAQESRRIFLQAGNEKWIAHTTLQIAQTLLEWGRAAEARTEVQAGLTIARKIGDLRTESYGLYTLAWLVGAEDPVQAQHLFRRAFLIARQIGDRKHAADILFRHGSLLRASGQAETAYLPIAVAARELSALGLPDGMTAAADLEALRGALSETTAASLDNIAQFLSPDEAFVHPA